MAWNIHIPLPNSGRNFTGTPENPSGIVRFFNNIGRTFLAPVTLLGDAFTAGAKRIYNDEGDRWIDQATQNQRQFQYPDLYRQDGSFNSAGRYGFFGLLANLFTGGGHSQNSAYAPEQPRYADGNNSQCQDGNSCGQAQPVVQQPFYNQTQAANHAPTQPQKTEAELIAETREVIKAQLDRTPTDLLYGAYSSPKQTNQDDLTEFLNRIQLTGLTHRSPAIDAAAWEEINAKHAQVMAEVNANPSILNNEGLGGLATQQPDPALQAKQASLQILDNLKGAAGVHVDGGLSEAGRGVFANFLQGIAGNDNVITQAELVANLQSKNIGIPTNDSAQLGVAAKDLSDLMASLRQPAQSKG